MKDIHVRDISNTIAKLCIDANYYIGQDIQEAFQEAVQLEEDALSKDVLMKLLENAEIAKSQKMPICQDTGMAVVFVEIGQDVHIVGGNLSEAIHEGVRMGYEEGFLRKSVVKDPVRRENTKDNTPAIIHYDIVEGEQLKITVAPKGFGSENMSRVVMLKPSDGIEGVKKVILDTVVLGDSNPCPPIVVGVGVGGTMEKAAILAKQALILPIKTSNSEEFWANIENEMLQKINAFGIGPAGFGGKTTALAVHILPFPTHIAGLPVAVNIGCHVTRHREAVL